MSGKAAAFLISVRRPGPPVGKMCVLCRGFCFVLAGAAAGILAQLADLFWANGGDFLSQMSVWIFLGTLISALSRSPPAGGALCAAVFGRDAACLLPDGRAGWRLLLPGLCRRVGVLLPHAALWVARLVWAGKGMVCKAGWRRHPRDDTALCCCPFRPGAGGRPDFLHFDRRPAVLEARAALS